MNLCNIYEQIGDFDNALASTLNSLNIHSDNPTAYMNLGSIYKSLGFLDQSLSSTHKSLELLPDNPPS